MRSNTKSKLEQVLRVRQELDEANQRTTLANNLSYKLFHGNPIPTSISQVEDGLFIDANEAYLEYFNLQRRDLIGHTSAELHLPLDPSIRPWIVEQVQSGNIIRNMELDIVHPSGDAKTILISVQSTVVENLDALILTFIDITERVQAERQIRELVSELSTTEQEERYRISQVLHDDVQQRIFAVKMQLTFMREAYEKNELDSIQVDFEKLDEWLAEVIKITRDLSFDLSPLVMAGEGLEGALQGLVIKMKEQFDLNVEVKAGDSNTAFSDNLRVLIYRTIRELLFNVVKHAQVLSAVVTIERVEDDRVRITVSDDGIGFDAKVVMEDKVAAHILLALRYRLSLFGCSMQVDSEPGHGTRVTIDCPLQEGRQDAHVLSSHS